MRQRIALALSFVVATTLARSGRADQESEALADARVKAAEAEAKAKIAGAEATAAKDARDKAEADLDAAKANKLLRYGITAGVGLALQTPYPSPFAKSTNARQSTLKFATMPYVVIVPAYWFKDDIVADYCTSKYTSVDQEEATKAAMARARKKAERGLSRKELADLRGSDPGKRERVEKHIDQIVTQGFDLSGQNPLWNPTLEGRCGWTQVGIYAGLPVNYNAGFKDQEDAASVRRDFEPTVSFGFGILPNAYISLLFGVTFGHYATVSGANQTSGQTDVERNAIALTIGVGGNVDILTKLFLH